MADYYNKNQILISPSRYITILRDTKTAELIGSLRLANGAGET